MRRFAWLLAGLVVVGVLARFVPRQGSDNLPDSTSRGSDDARGYVAIDAEVLQTDADGRPLYRLWAARVERPATGGVVSLSKPRLSYEPTANSSWTLQADTGELAPDSEQLELTGAVVARGANESDPPLTLRTDTLALDLRQQRADTNARVFLEQAPMQLNAQGLHLNLSALTWTLDGDGHFTLRR